MSSSVEFWDNETEQAENYDSSLAGRTQEADLLLHEEFLDAVSHSAYLGRLLGCLWDGFVFLEWSVFSLS